MTRACTGGEGKGDMMRENGKKGSRGERMEGDERIVYCKRFNFAGFIFRGFTIFADFLF